MAETPKPWGFWHQGCRIGRRSTRQAAIRAADKFLRWGGAVVINTVTGETWKRRGGTWGKTRDGWPTTKTKKGAA